jgi:hypothetical protein
MYNTNYTAVLDSQTFDGFRIYVKPFKVFKLQVDPKILENMNEKLWKSLVLGTCEIIGGITLFKPVKAFEEGIQTGFSIPPDYGYYGQFGIQVEGNTITIHNYYATTNKDFTHSRAIFQFK